MRELRGAIQSVCERDYQRCIKSKDARGGKSSKEIKEGFQEEVMLALGVDG